jgi:hypothetical protein
MGSILEGVVFTVLVFAVYAAIPVAAYFIIKGAARSGTRQALRDDIHLQSAVKRAVETALDERDLRDSLRRQAAGQGTLAQEARAE